MILTAGQDIGTIHRNLSISAFGVNLGLQGGFHTSTDRTYYVNLDLLIPFSTNGTIKVDDEETRNNIDTSLSSTAINLTLGATFHIRWLGGFSRDF